MTDDDRAGRSIRTTTRTATWLGRSRPTCRWRSARDAPSGTTGCAGSTATTGDGARTTSASRFACQPTPGAKSHTFSVVALPNRHPTHEHPDSGHACENCDHEYIRHEGPRTGGQFTFTLGEVAEALIRAGRGDSYREIAEATRRRSERYAERKPIRTRRRPKRVPVAGIALPAGVPLGGLRAAAPVRFPSPPRPRAPRIDRNYSQAKAPPQDKRPSRQPGLMANWIDAFAPIVLEDARRGKAWPEVVAIDAHPVRRRVWVGAQKKSGGEGAGEILAAAVPVHGRRSKLFHMVYAGGKDADSWEDFLRSLPGEPVWVVADKDAGIAAAVKRVWPHATLYRCEAHLRRNAEEALARDGYPLLKYGTNPLHDALHAAQWTATNWQAFVALVESTIPPEREATRRWIAENEALVLSQIGIRKQNPDYPLSTGALEAELAKVKTRLKQRIGPMSNYWRLSLLLELMAAEAAGPPTVAGYTAALRRHFQGRGGVAPSDWAARRDQAGARSTDDFLAASEARAKAAIAMRNTSHKAVKADRQLRERNAARAAVGLPPILPGKRRRSVPDVYVPTGGRKVADDAELMAEWDAEKNAEAGLDPAKLGLASGKVAHWRCANGHTWTAPIIRRGTKRTSCRYCMNRDVAPENSLAALYPDVAAEWHPTLNELTAEQVTPGSYRLVYWQCRKGLGHPDYRMRPVTRTAQGQGCRECGLERVRTWQRERRDRTAEGGPGGSAPSDVEVGGLTPEDVGGDGFPF